MNAISLLSTEAVTMTSREIADLTGKEHKNVLADIRMMLDEVGKAAAEFSATAQIAGPNGSTRQIEVFNLPKRESLILVSGYSISMRAKIIDRWQELEAGAVPRTMAQALRLAADQAEQMELQQQQLAAAKPAVEFVQRFVESDGLKGFREVCKLLKANEARFREFLTSRRVMYRLAGKMAAYQPHIDAGRFEVRTGVAASDHAYTSTLFTPKGVEWIAGEWGKYQLSHGDAQ